MKLLIQESGTDLLMEFWLQVNDRDKVISAITQVEACSAIHRWLMEGRITADEASTTLASVAENVRRLTGCPITEAVLEAAMAVVGRRNLRALDAIQLASAIIARETLAPTEMRFIASDHALLEAAEAEGFTTWNPQG